MNRALIYVAGGILLLTSAALLSLTTLAQKGVPDAGTAQSLEAFNTQTNAQLQALRGSARSLSANLDQARSEVSSVASARTPTPGINQFNQQFVGAVREADDNRERRLRPVEQQLALLSQQLVDLQQRATSMEIQIQDAIRELSVRVTETAKASGGKSGSIEALVAVVGIMCSVITLILALRKDGRESRETELKILELEQKLAQSTKASANLADA